jgi:hypothetical protein
VLNHNAVIVMSVTAEDYIGAAKSTISLILNNFGLFVVVDLIGSLVSFCIGLAIIFIPVIAGYFLIVATQETFVVEEVLIGVAAILLLSVISANIFLSVLTEALSCIFIFYCFDKKFNALGYSVAQNVPTEMKTLFLDLQNEQREEFPER